jgi:phospholipase C
MCYEAYDPGKIPNLAALAAQFVIADHTFQSDQAASWGAHLSLVAATSDGFYGNNPCQGLPGQSTICAPRPFGPGWGCDSNRDALWAATTGTMPTSVPSCVPFRNGSGTYLDGSGKTSPVPWVPTVMDRLDQANLTWRLYAGTAAVADGTAYQDSGYQWATCPSFADCLETSQRNNLVNANQVLTDATNGTLPALSIVTPTAGNSQHNTQSMKLGDNWIGQVVAAIEDGPNWPSTAIFITYDDCGCFYDHVAPPSPQLGIRVPMVIVSPFAKRGRTDSNVASYASLLAFTEYVFDLRPLAAADAGAYNFLDSFDFGIARLSPVAMVTSAVPADELAYIAAHPGTENDPT